MLVPLKEKEAVALAQIPWLELVKVKPAVTGCGRTVRASEAVEVASQVVPLIFLAL